MQNTVGPRSIRNAALAILVVILVAGCLGPRVEVMPSGQGARAEQKPSGCRIDFHRTKVDRPYVEIAAIHASGGDTFKNGAGAFHRALQDKACELGADAVIVTQDYLGPGSVMDGVAIKYQAATRRFCDPCGEGAVLHRCREAPESPPLHPLD